MLSVADDASLRAHRRVLESTLRYDSARHAWHVDTQVLASLCMCACVCLTRAALQRAIASVDVGADAHALVADVAPAMLGLHNFNVTARGSNGTGGKVV
jgi:hypothetical protein